MRTRMYGGVRGRKTKVGGKPTFVFLLLDCPGSFRVRLALFGLIHRHQCIAFFAKIVKLKCQLAVPPSDKSVAAVTSRFS